MLTGAHVILYSQNSDADRAFFTDVLELRSVDQGGGWLIFGLPPAELAMHPAQMEGGTHELFLMCADIEAFRATVIDRGAECSDVMERGWGRLVNVQLPSGASIGVYQPSHASPPHSAAKAKKPAARAKAVPKKKPKAKVTKKPAPKKAGKRAR